MKRLQHGAASGALVLLCLAGLQGCDKKPDPPKGRVVAKLAPHKLAQWLTVKDKIEPPLWLRSREVGHDVLDTDPEVDRLRRAMHQVTLRFFEDERMIANRTAQTADMLAEFGQQERYVDIMTGMVDVADASPNRQLYGEMCQHYLNLRKSGKDRTAVLQQLFDSYKSQNALR